MSRSYVGLKAQDMGFDAHLTLCYTGELSSLDEYNLTERLRLIKFSGTVVQRSEIRMFGPDNNIPVITVIPLMELYDLKRKVDAFATSISEFGWNPHITLRTDHRGPLNIPEYINLSHLDFY